MARAAAAALAGGLALSWLLASPASAENLTVTIDSPTEGRRYEQSTLTVSGHVETGLLTSVDRVRVVVVRDYDGFVLADDLACERCGQQANVPFSYETPALEYNGPYSVEVVASGHVLLNGIPVSDASARRSFTVAVRPAAPTSLKAERLPDGKVKLTWGAVPGYPDLIGYLVYRAAPGAELKPIKAVPPGTTSYVDEQTVGGGNFQYRVASVRSGAVPGESSEWLLADSNLATVTVPAPSVPPTTGIGPPGPNGPGSPGPGGNSVDLSQFFNSAAGDIRLPAPAMPTPTLTLPDNGFDPNLPFGDVAGLKPPTQSARPGGTPGSRTDLAEPGEDEDANRRALFVPVAAGCVLCVAALHLRWLSRRLAMPAGLAGAADLEPAEPGLDADLDGEPIGGASQDPLRQPVAAGAGPAPPGP